MASRWGSRVDDIRPNSPGQKPTPDSKPATPDTSGPVPGRGRHASSEQLSTSAATLVEPPALAQISPFPRLVRVREQPAHAERERARAREPEERGVPRVRGDVRLDGREARVEVLRRSASASASGGAGREREWVLTRARRSTMFSECLYASV